MLDEYLQATILSVAKDRVTAEVRLVPGVEVFRTVLATIDTDADGVISEAEQRAYAQRVLRDLSLTIDGSRLQLKLVSLTFPTVGEMKEGLGTIRIDLDAEVPQGGHNRRLIFENHHQSRTAAYLVNCLVPHDPAIRVLAQDRNYEQSFYQLDYTQAPVRSRPPLRSAWWSGTRRWLGAVALVPIAGFAVLWRRRRRGDVT